jgi:hypothetical protein
MVDVAGELMLTITKIQEWIDSGDWTQMSVIGSEEWLHSKTYITRMGIMLEVTFSKDKVTHIRQMSFVQAG